jgi:hypothetical protein
VLVIGGFGLIVLAISVGLSGVPEKRQK